MEESDGSGIKGTHCIGTRVTPILRMCSSKAVLRDFHQPSKESILG